MTNQISSEILLKGRLSGNQKNRLANLLDMMYTPTELAEEIGFERRQIYRAYIPAGCPHEKDEKNRIWINGEKFRDWLLKVYKKAKLGENESFCLTCRRPVPIIDPEKKYKFATHYILSNCPYCGRRISKLLRRGN